MAHQGIFLCGGSTIWIIYGLRLTNAFLSNQHSVDLMSQRVCHFSRKMIVILHKILFNGSISDHKNTFYDFFFGSICVADF